MTILDPEEPRKPETGAQNRSWVPYNHSQGLQRDLRGVQNELRDPPEDLPEHPKAPSGVPDPLAAASIPENLHFSLVFICFSPPPLETLVCTYAGSAPRPPAPETTLNYCF